MKKTYDWNIRILVNVKNNNKNIEIVTSVHANVHQIKIEILKQLGLSVFDTQMDLYHSRNQPMKATSSLLQNQIENNARVTAVIGRIKAVESLIVDKSEENHLKSKQKGKIDMLGLSVVSVCTNKDCSNYGEDIQINYGYGQFPILQISAKTKCQICPYRSQFLQPEMMCKQIRLSHCLYKLAGTYLNGCGIQIKEETKYIKLMKQKQISSFLREHPWNINMSLTVKHL